MLGWENNAQDKQTAERQMGNERIYKRKQKMPTHPNHASVTHILK